MYAHPIIICTWYIDRAQHTRRSYLNHGGQQRVKVLNQKKITDCNLPENGSDHDFCSFWSSTFEVVLLNFFWVCALKWGNCRTKRVNQKKKKKQFSDMIMLVKKIHLVFSFFRFLFPMIIILFDQWDWSRMCIFCVSKWMFTYRMVNHTNCGKYSSSCWRLDNTQNNVWKVKKNTDFNNKVRRKKGKHYFVRKWIKTKEMSDAER